MDEQSLGLMHVYTGNGKGKSSAGFGLALRAWGQDLRVCIIQWIKSTEYSGEFKAVSSLEGIEIRQFGAGRFFGNERPSQEDIRLAEEGLRFAEGALSSGDYDLVILDELSVAVHLKLLDVEEVLRVLKGRAQKVEVVVTGRYAPSTFYDISDYITEFHAVKHPFEKGIPARRGIEY